MSLHCRARKCGISASRIANSQIGQWIPRGKGRNNKDIAGPQPSYYQTTIKGVVLMPPKVRQKCGDAIQKGLEEIRQAV